MKKSFFILLLFFMSLSNAVFANDEPGPAFFNWSELPALPDKVGFAGAFAGVSNDVLLVAGGTNFPEGATPWNGGKKVWYDKIFALENTAGTWKEVGRLPQALGYGVSVSYKDLLVCVGGSDAAKHHAEVYALHYNKGTINITQWPSLPRALANASGAIVHNTLYIVGGTETPDGLTGQNFWSLDLLNLNKGWRELPAWPGPSRMLAVCGVQEGAFYLFSGVHLTKNKDDSLAKREFLKDAYRYVPGKSWARLADLPHPAAAAPGPAFSSGQSHLLIFGGDAGNYFAQNAKLKEKHPGFSNKILGYNTITNSWAAFGDVLTDKKHDAAENPNGSLWAPVTTPVVVWKGNIVLPAGEVRPGVRTPRVLMASPHQPSGNFNWLDWGVVALYFLLVIGISV